MTADPTPAIRERLAAATDGPWAPWRDQDGTPHMNGLLMVGNADAVIPDGESWVEGVDVNPIAHTYTPEDREFIAHAPEDIEWLLGEVERLTRLSNLAAQELNRTSTESARLEADNARLRAAVCAVRVVHAECAPPEACGVCHECVEDYPCRTIRALATHLPDDTKEA